MKAMEQARTKPEEIKEKILKNESFDVGEEIITEGEKLRRDEEKERETRARESFKLNTETKTSCEIVLKEHSDELLRDLAEEYYNENEDLIKKETKVYSKDISREAKYDIVRNLGIFDQLKNKKGNWTEGQFDKFALAEGYDELRAQLKSEKMSAETPALILNSLEARRREIQEKLDKRDMVGENLDYALNGTARLDAVKKYNKIFSAQVELAEKIYGGSLIGDKEKNLLNKFGYAGQGVIDDKVILKEKEQETRKETKEKVFGKEWNILNDTEKTKHNNNFETFVKSKVEKQLNETARKYGMDEEAVLALMNKGYSPENFHARGNSYKFGLGKKIYVGNGREGLSKKEFREFIKQHKEDFEKEIIANAKQKMNMEASSARDLFLGLKEKVSKLAFEPESAQEELLKSFAGLKEKMINEAIIKDIKKEDKTREQLGKIARKFEGGDLVLGANDLLKTLVSRKNENLSQLTGDDFDKDFDSITKFFGDFGISTDSFGTMDDGKKAEFKKKYKKNAKRKKGFVTFMLDLAEAVLSPGKK